MSKLGDRLSKAWNAFTNRDPTNWSPYINYGSSSSLRPDRPRLTRGRDKSIVTSVYNRIAVDVASINILHAYLDENNRYIETIYSELQECLSVTANIDQTGRQLLVDIVMSLLDEGCVAVVPIDMDLSKNGDIKDISSLRVGKITEWFPKHVRVYLYNDNTGMSEYIIIEKSKCAIIENPFYSTMNEPSSTAQRLIKKMNLLDIVDEQNNSGKLDLIVQLPYVVKTESRKKEAERRRAEIEEQLTNRKYGVAYTDGTEKIVQLNRPIENQLLKQVEYLTDMLYSQLGINTDILKGTATEQAMLNYYTHTVEPILVAITEEMCRKFIPKKNRDEGESIIFVRDPFKLVPINNIADIADKFTRNEILSSNDVRSIIGFKPSSDPNADELRNKNINMSNDQYNDMSQLQNEEVDEY